MQLQNETRGFRNNNPGNIRHSEKWLGLAEKQTDPDFCQFVSVEYGIRAIFKILETYRDKYGLKTVREIITKWAPPSENDTEAYIKGVCDYIRNRHVTVFPDDEIEGWYLYSVVAGIIHHENGVQPFYTDFFEQCKDIE